MYVLYNNICPFSWGVSIILHLRGVNNFAFVLTVFDLSPAPSSGQRGRPWHTDSDHSESVWSGPAENFAGVQKDVRENASARHPCESHWEFVQIKNVIDVWNIYVHWWIGFLLTNKFGLYRQKPRGTMRKFYWCSVETKQKSEHLNQNFQDILVRSAAYPNKKWSL